MGKGSTRRKEDTQKIRDNWDNIFGRKDNPQKEDKHPEPEKKQAK